jgi:hypothetical protein
MVYRKNPKTMQVRTLAKRVNRPVGEVRKILSNAGVRNAKGGRSFSQSDSVNTAEALETLGLQMKKPEPTPEPPPAPAAETHLDKLAADARAASTKVPDPVPTKGRGGEDDPVDAAILSGEHVPHASGIPMPTHGDKDKIYYWIHTNPNRQDVMYQRGWRWVSSLETALKIRPDGLFVRKFNKTIGRIRHDDLELAFIPRHVFMKYKEARATGSQERKSASMAGLTESAEKATEMLRNAGAAPGTRVEAFEMSEEEATSRQTFSQKVAAGESPSASRTFVGKAAGK